MRTVHVSALLSHCLLLSSALMGQPCDDVNLVNDSLGSGGNANVCPCFVADEIALAIFDVPPADSVVLTQIGIQWKSVLGIDGRSTEDAIIVFDMNQSGPVNPATFSVLAEIPEPRLRDGFLNVFDVSAFNIELPANRFGVGLRFRHNQGILDASVVNDLDGFNDGPETVRNWVFTSIGEWRTSQALGVNGDWVFRMNVEACQTDDLHLENPVPGSAGENNTFTVSGAEPGADVTYFYGFAGGSTNVDGCPGVSVDIRNAAVAGAATADGEGRAALVRFVPGVAADRAIRLQAVEIGACDKSNLLTWVF